MTGIDAGYDYVNARLRAMRSRLFDRDAYEPLLAAPDVTALVAGLEQSSYRDALESSLVTQTGLSAVLRALQIDQSATLQRIGGFCGGDTAEAFTIQLAPYARHNTVTLLRGVASRADPNRLFLALVPAPPFREGELAELARQTTVRALVDLLVQWNKPTPTLARSLAGHLTAEMEVAVIETAFDAAWAETTMAAIASLPDDEAILLRLDLARFLDLHNLLLALDLRGIRLETPAPWLRGGALPVTTLDKLQNAGVPAEMVEALAGVAPAAFWLPALAAWDGNRTADLQQAWEAALARWRIGLFAAADPLGPGIFIAYLAAKEAELRNLRLIAEAVAGNLDRDDARRSWLLPST